MLIPLRQTSSDKLYKLVKNQGHLYQKKITYEALKSQDYVGIYGALKVSEINFSTWELQRTL